MKGGGGLAKALERYGNKRVVAHVGVLDGATYPDGESVAQVAFWNEYGHKGTIPARSQRVYRSLNEKTGSFNKKGQFVRKDKSNFESWVTIPSYEINVPPRPFFRNAIEAEKAGLKKLAVELLAKGVNEDKAVRLMAEQMVVGLEKSVTEFSDPPNAYSTEKAKGFNNPLLGPIKGRMLVNSFSYEVIDDES